MTSNPQSHNPSRRRFLRNSLIASAATSLPAIISASSLGGEGKVAPSDKLTLGVIGIGPRCTYDLKEMRQHASEALLAGGFVRLAMGLEDPQDLIADLAQALNQAWPQG
jgi:hypothetical protein